MQKNPLSKFAVHHFLRCLGLLFKIGLILIIVLSATSDIAVSRIAEENDETQTETITPSDNATTPDSGDPKTPSEDGNYSEFGLLNRNPFDTGGAPKHFIWQDEKEQPEKDAEDSGIQPYLDSLRRWRHPPELTDLSKLYNWKPKPKRDEKGIALPMDSNLRITGLQSVTVEANKTHYFGSGDLNRYGGYGYGGGYGGYSSGLDLGLTSSYGYEGFGYSGGGFDDTGYGNRIRRRIRQQTTEADTAAAMVEAMVEATVDLVAVASRVRQASTYVRYSNLGCMVVSDNAHISPWIIVRVAAV